MNNHKLKAIANMNRLSIIKLLNDKTELNVGDLEKATKLSQSAISQHLAIMREANLVKTRREAQQIFYSLKDSKVLSVAQMLLNW